jgi:RNA polymerase sigma factor (sigma-70 family)
MNEEQISRIYKENPPSELAEYVVRKQWVKDFGEAEGFAQDVIVELMQMDKPPESARAYLLRGIKNRCIKLTEHYKVRDNLRKKVEGGSIGGSSGRSNSPSSSNDPLDILGGGMDFEAAIKTLTPDEQNVFILYTQGKELTFQERADGVVSKQLSLREIADQSHLSLTTTRRIYQSAVEKLRGYFLKRTREHGEANKCILKLLEQTKNGNHST